LTRMKELLSDTDLPLDKIAEMTGFNYVESMCHRFKGLTGQTPGEYRKAMRVRTVHGLRSPSAPGTGGEGGERLG
jgi:LacI family transcriptional regulator